MTADRWRALEADPRVTLSSTASWMENDDARVDAS